MNRFILALLACGLVVSGSAFAEEESPAGTHYYTWLQDPWTGETKLTLVPHPDQSLWNAARVEDYDHALAAEGAPALGVLTIDRLGLQVPIYNGTSEFNLDRGLGRIRGMARPNEDGNLGISGHRDGFFRGLKDIQAGDKIMVRTTERVEVYAVSDITIVNKEEVSILTAIDDKMLTLVTCYPFYFVGNAPQRYIVHAVPLNAMGEGPKPPAAPPDPPGEESPDEPESDAS